MIQHTDSQAKQEAATKGKIFVCSASMVHCCNRRSEMTNLQPLIATNSPDLSTGTWTLTLADVLGQPRRIVLHDVLFTPARKASMLSVVKLGHSGWEIDSSRSFMYQPVDSDALIQLLSTTAGLEVSSHVVKTGPSSGFIMGLTLVVGLFLFF
jgi:hypothetical protein